MNEGKKVRKKKADMEESYFPKMSVAGAKVERSACWKHGWFEPVKQSNTDCVYPDKTHKSERQTNRRTDRQTDRY